MPHYAAFFLLTHLCVGYSFFKYTNALINSTETGVAGADTLNGGHY